MFKEEDLIILILMLMEMHIMKAVMEKTIQIGAHNQDLKKLIKMEEMEIFSLGQTVIQLIVIYPKLNKTL